MGVMEGQRSWGTDIQTKRTRTVSVHLSQSSSDLFHLHQTDESHTELQKSGHWKSVWF